MQFPRHLVPWRGPLFFRRIFASSLDLSDHNTSLRNLSLIAVKANNLVSFSKYGPAHMLLAPVKVQGRRNSKWLGSNINVLEMTGGANARPPTLLPHRSIMNQPMHSPDESSLPDLPYVDVVIVGGGACGVAAVVQLIERVRQGNQIRSITLIEKSKSVGPGLAYSKACAGTILNMPADTMGLYTDNPEHFSQWMSTHSPGVKEDLFPLRSIYGQYLASLMQSAAADAERLGVILRVAHGEVVDLQRVGEFLELILANGTKIWAQDVILALGNFSAAVHDELSGTPGYFSSPWPIDRLKDIPHDASVCIFGSRLSAIDTAIALAENGHHGSITFVSRSGRLPQVQGVASPFSRRYALHSLARDVEASADGAFNKVVQAIRKEIERITVFDWAKVAAVDDPLTELRSSIINAKSGAISWQAVLRVTAPLMERYWNCFSSKEKETFLRDHLSSWFTYRHTMPLKNAQKILALLEKGQLRVVRGGKGRQSGLDFVFPAEGGEIRSRYLIEAIGQEHHPHRVSSPLMQRLLSSEMLHSHPAGGVSVDFSTLAAGKGLYVIGSMTTGTHFYTNAIDRSAAHAARIADSIIGKSVRRSLHIMFFAGSDLFSHLMLSKLVPRLIAQGHVPFICLPMDKVNEKISAFDLRELSFFERQLLQEHVIPFLGSSIRKGAACQTVEQMRSRYGILVEKVSSVNMSSFLELLRIHHIDAGISLRCYQRFGKGILQHFRSPRALLNLHPGVLPSYRGVISAIRAMANGEHEFGYTLHHVNQNYDSGDILDIRTRPIDYEKSMLHFMGDVYEIGVEMVLDAVENLARGTPLSAFPQNAVESRYYSFPAEEELEGYRRDGLRLVDPLAIQDLIVRAFAPPGDENVLREVIERAVRQWYDDNDDSDDAGVYLLRSDSTSKRREKRALAI